MKEEKVTIEELISSCKNEDFKDNYGPSWEEYREILDENIALKANTVFLQNNIATLSKNLALCLVQIKQGTSLLRKAAKHIKFLETRQDNIKNKL